MSKRFTATEKWDKEWFMKLSPKHKCIWLFINDKCDQAGMWEINYMVASMYIGEPVTEEDFIFFGKRVEKFSKDKFWIVDHIDFQCGYLSEKCPAHKPVFKLLIKYNLLDRVLNRLSYNLQEQEEEEEKDKEKDKDKDKDKETPKNKLEIVIPFQSEAFEHAWGNWKTYRKQSGKPYRSELSEQAALKKLSNYPEDVAIKMIEESIANSWQGIFELKTNNNGKSTIKTGNHITAEGTLHRLNSYTND